MHVVRKMGEGGGEEEGERHTNDTTNSDFDN